MGDASTPTRATFSTTSDPLLRELRQRVDDHFRARGTASTGDRRMAAKVAVTLCATVVTFVVIVSGALPAGGALAACVLLGFCMAATGFNVAHDAVHGAASATPWVNRALGHVLDVFGANARNWDVHHNFAHHSYTNVAGLDSDVEPGPILRFHPHGTPAWFHRFQHVYAFALYALAFVAWVFVKDAKQVLRPDPRTRRRAPLVDVVSVAAWKLVHFGVYLGLPLVWSGYAPHQVAIGYFTTLVAAGLPIALVFQLPHVGDEAAFPTGQVVDGAVRLDGSWAAHQLKTTANFAPRSRFWSAITGGQNHQIEHHLLPKICHVHLAELAPIVRDVALRHGLPYREHATVGAALRSHVRAMKRFGTAR